MTAGLAQFADSSSGLGAFNVNWKSFGFQLVTFFIVLLVFKRWILPPITKTLEERRKVLEQSLEQAKQTKDTLAKAEQEVEKMLTGGRQNADKVIASAREEARGLVSEAEGAGRAQVERLLAENQQQLEQAKTKLKAELRSELGELVVDTTEKVLRQKITAQADMELIKRAAKELK